MRKSIVVLSLGLMLAAVVSAPASAGIGRHARHVPKALRLAAADPTADTTPTGTLHFAYRHGSLVCFGRFAHLTPGAQYQFQWGAQSTTPTTFTATRRGCAKFVTAAPPTDPNAGQAQASVTPVDVGVPVLYCDWDAMMFGGTPPAGGPATPPDPTTTPPTTTPPDPATPPATPPQGGSSTWGGWGMGCGWR